MDLYEELQQRIEEVKELREQIQIRIRLIKDLKEKHDAAWDRVTLLMSEIKTSSDGELRASLFPLEKGVSDETRNTIDGLVAVLDAANQWMPIQDLTDMALLDGVRTTSANPSRVFSTALSTERGKENPRVVLHNNKWGLSHWDRPRRVRRRRRRVEETN